MHMKACVYNDHRSVVTEWKVNILISIYTVKAVLKVAKIRNKVTIW